jgi:hypothetical protein
MASLVDTCGWIEWLTDGLLADAFKPYLDDPAELIIPTTLQFELYKRAKREKKRSFGIGSYHFNRTRVGLTIDYPAVFVCGRHGFAT